MSAYAQSIQFLLSQVRRAAGSLEDGTVTAYAAGTTTPKTIWLDRGKQTEAANPYTLDANGTAALFGDGLYRFVIKSASGTIVYDRDYISIKDVSTLAYDVSDYASLAAAVSVIGSTPATLQYSSDQTLSSNLTIPANIELMPINGAVINHGAYTISYAGSTSRWPMVQIFNGSGAVTGLAKAYPEWFGGSAGGVVESSAAINKAITASLNVEIGPGTWRCDNPVAPRTFGNLAIKGELKRITAYSVSTRPVLQINNVQLSTVSGGGRITSQNASPDGVVLLGPEDPSVDANQTIDNQWNTIKNISITGAGLTAGNKGLAMQSTAGWTGGKVAYQNWIQNFEVHSVDVGVYVGAQVNGNFIKNIHGWNIGSILIHLNGADGNDGIHGAGTYPYSSITDNLISGIFTSNSFTLTYTIKGDNSSYNVMSDLHGEPGAGRLFALNANCESNYLAGIENHPQAGTDAGTRNTIITNITVKTTSASFSALNSVSNTNVTGDGTTYQIVCDTEVKDKTGNYDVVAGGFTAPVTGQYMFSGNMYLTGLGAAHTSISIRLVTSNRTYLVYTETVSSQAKTSISIPWAAEADMDAGDTAFVTVQVSGGAKTVNVFGGASPSTTFTGHQIL